MNEVDDVEQDSEHEGSLKSTWTPQDSLILLSHFTEFDWGFSSVGSGFVWGLGSMGRAATLAGPSSHSHHTYISLITCADATSTNPEGEEDTTRTMNLALCWLAESLKSHTHLFRLFTQHVLR